MADTIHPIDRAGTELPPKLNSPFAYEPHPLCRRAYDEVLSWPLMRESGTDFHREISRGKMFGVLIVADDKGNTGFLAAFSGQICGRFDWPGFVPPVVDYLSPTGHFKTEESEISAINRQIESIEKTSLRQSVQEYAHEEARLRLRVVQAEDERQRGKVRRDSRRAEGKPSKAEEEAMTRESQYLKAEVARAKAALKQGLLPFRERVDRLKFSIDSLKESRRQRSERLQQWLFDHTLLLCGSGERLSASAVFARYGLPTPPSGTGECCAPKLLQYAFAHHLRPVAMAEYWFGQSPRGEVRHHGSHYPACRGKCGPLMRWMLRGVEVESPEETGDDMPPLIIYEDDNFCVVNKPSGLLSIPGTTERTSVLTFLRKHYGPCRDVRMAHRLDEDTSGLIIATFGLDSYRRMQALFASRQIEKTYIAVLDGDLCRRGVATEGEISLPLMPDVTDRPRQIVSTKGRESITHYKILACDGEGHTRVEFRPHTGRTHQLRVHSASPAGLDAPIVGDRLYGRRRDLSSRLLLHAAAISFVSPFDGKEMRFESRPDF